MSAHKPKSIRVAASNDNKNFTEVGELNFTPEEIFREGTYIENLKMNLGGISARYVRIIAEGAGECPADHVRPGQEARVYMDEVIIE